MSSGMLNLDHPAAGFSEVVSQAVKALVGFIPARKTLFPIGTDRGAVAVLLGIDCFFSFGEIIA